MTKLKVLLVCLFALFAAQAPSALAQTKPVVRIATLDIGPFVPVGYVEKLAAKHGFEVKMTRFRRGLEAAQAVKSGDVDIGVGGVEAAIAAVAGGAPAVIIAGVSNKGLSWVARSDQKIASIQDMKGKKFGVIRGLHELVARAEFDKHGLQTSEQPDKDKVQIVFIPSSPAAVNALKIREVDVASAPEPFPSKAIQDGYATFLLRPFDTAMGNLPRAVFARRDFLQKNPEGAQLFVNALVEAVKTFRDSPKVAEDYAINEELKGAVTVADWELALKNQDWDVSLTEELVQAHIDAMLKFGMIRAPMKASDITDLTMLKKAQAKMGW